MEYSRIIGSLMYLMSCTRSDIAYLISKLSRFTSNAGFDHWKMESDHKSIEVLKGNSRLWIALW